MGRNEANLHTVAVKTLTVPEATMCRTQLCVGGDYVSGAAICALV
jgi:hypothetical protein